MDGSGLNDPAYLVRRGDDQIVQLSELVHLVLLYLHQPLSTREVAEAVSAAYGRTLTSEGLEHLICTRLAPLGLAESTDAVEPTRAPKANPLLALAVKRTLVPAAITRELSSALTPLYRPPAVAGVGIALVALDIAVAVRGNLWGAVTELFATPTLLLAIYGLLALGAMVHELGHAAACRYGGAQPGEIGVGLYLVFPAFYTDVTDSYRLDRAGRVRTDLGGLYFNALFVMGLGIAYFASGHGLFLLTGLVMQVQMLQQLLPVVRFDGYYVLADLAGVPDLFARVGPVLRSLRPGRPLHPRVAELRPFARRMVVGWVLAVVPALTGVLAWFLWNLPEFVHRAVFGLELQQLAAATAWSRRDVPMLALAVLSVALILLPLIGITVVLWRLLSSLARFLGSRWRPIRTKENNMSFDTGTEIPAGPPLIAGRPLAQRAEEPAVPSPRRPSAADFTDAAMLPVRAPVPTQGWRKVVHRASGHLVNPGRSPEELRREALEQRLRTPINGSRRVVVMSRKGGVGKTTVTLALGSTFASIRGDRVIAVDANPDAGNLAHRVGPPHDRTVTDVLRDADSIESYAMLRAYALQAVESRLEVLPSDDDPRIGMALDRSDYHRLIELLDRFYNLILLDTGTGILDSANQGLLEEADQLVLVLRPGVDGGRAAALTLDWMDEHGFEELVEHAVVVINGVRPGVGAPPDPMRRHFEKRCDRVLSVPWDPALEVGAQTDVSGLRRQTRESIVEIAAAVSDNFRELGARR